MTSSELLSSIAAVQRADRSRSRLHGLSPEAVAEDQRRRIASAFGEAISHRGYHDTPVEDIIVLAGVSRRTFYDLFTGKDDAFCAAHGEALALLVERVCFACRHEREWPQKAAAAILVALQWLAADPNRARLIVGEPLTAGPRMAYCHDLLVARFAPSLRRGRQRSPNALPPKQEEVLLTGIAAVVAGRLRLGRAAELPGLAPELTRLVLTPYLDPAGRKRSRRDGRPRFLNSLLSLGTSSTL